MDEPKIPPHIMFQMLAKLAKEHGYGIEYDVTLSYRFSGEVFVCKMRGPENIND